jgi:hypothetical protein
MESQIQLNDDRKRLLSKFSQALPKLMTVVRSVTDEAYKEGALSK